jgi:ribosomal protein S18 acetylase RimI-like enzyme
MDVMEYKGMNKTETTPVKTRRVGVELLPVWIQIFAESFEVSSSQAEEYLSRGRHLLRFTNTELLLAEIDSEVAGCVALYSKDRIGGIYFIATLPRFRRRGVASALLSAAVSRSIAHGNYSTILQTLRQSNLAKFYNKNDFDRRYSKEIYILE